MISSILFDLDGLLIDSERLYRKVTYEMAEGFGKVMTEEIRAQQIGRSPLEANRIFREALGILSHTAEELMHIRNRRMLEEFERDLVILPGAREIVHALEGRYRLAISTGSPRMLLEAALEKMELGHCFEVIVTSDEITRGKPDPEIYLKTIQILGVQANECMVLEDSVNGVISGCAAGCRVIAVPGDHTPGNDFTGAEAVVSDLFEALEYINREK